MMENAARFPNTVTSNAENITTRCTEGEGGESVKAQRFVLAKALEDAAAELNAAP